MALCLGIAAAAFAVRMAVSAELLGADTQVSNPSGMTDMWTYKDLCERILKGEYIKTFYYQPFYYAVFLPLAHTALGASAWAVIIAQSLLGAGAVFVASMAAARLWGRRAGVMAGILTAFSAALILYTPYRLIETMQSFWIALLFLLTLLAMRKGGATRWSLAGLVLSFSILSRGNSWAFLPFMVAACVYGELVLRKGAAAKGGRFLQTAFCLLALFLFAILPQLPFAWRNSESAGSLCGPSTAGGAVLALGNTPEAPPGGRNPEAGPGPMEYPPAYQAWMASEDKVSIPKRMWQWFKEEPLAFLELNFRKALLFWDWREIPNNISFDYNGGKSGLFRFLGLFPTGLLSVLAIACAILSARSLKAKKGLLLLLGFVAAYWLATAAFYILARFRAPVIPLLGVAGAGFLELCLRDAAKRRGRPLIFKLGAFALAAFIALSAYDLYRFGFEAKVMRSVRPNGVRVALSDSETEFLDCGPASFGGWQPLRLESGMKLTKILPRAPEPAFKRAKLSIPCVWPGGGRALVAVNGQKRVFDSAKAGMGALEFELPAPPDGRFDIEIMGLDAELFLFLDIQRDYGRTLLNGRPAKAELCARASLFK